MPQFRYGSITSMRKVVLDKFNKKSASIPLRFDYITANAKQMSYSKVSLNSATVRLHQYSKKDVNNIEESLNSATVRLHQI